MYISSLPPKIIPNAISLRYPWSKDLSIKPNPSKDRFSAVLVVDLPFYDAEIEKILLSYLPQFDSITETILKAPFACKPVGGNWLAFRIANHPPAVVFGVSKGKIAKECLPAQTQALRLTF